MNYDQLLETPTQGRPDYESSYVDLPNTPATGTYIPNNPNDLLNRGWDWYHWNPIYIPDHSGELRRLNTEVEELKTLILELKKSNKKILKCLKD